jgi:lipid-A-disaccharide synthase-like uncharacterized protein
MDWTWSSSRFLGIEWHVWKIVGWIGNLAFFMRFFVQWYASEKRKQVVIPIAFWWLSLFGSFCLLGYALFYQKDSVFIFAYAFTWIPYVRNLIIQKRSISLVRCGSCKNECSATAKFCSSCGAALVALPSSKLQPSNSGD